MHLDFKFLKRILSLLCARHCSQHFVHIISLASIPFPTKLYEGDSVSVLSLQMRSRGGRHLVWTLARIYTLMGAGPDLSSAHLTLGPIPIPTALGSLSLDSGMLLNINSVLLLDRNAL